MLLATTRGMSAKRQKRICHLVARGREIVEAADIGVTFGFDLLIVRL